MKKLPLEISKNGFTYKQVKRNEKIAIYSQYDPIFKKIVGWEVFFIKIQKENDVIIDDAKVHYELKELFPSNEKFGTSAWSYMKASSAERMFAYLSSSQYPKDYKEDRYMSAPEKAKVFKITDSSPQNQI